MRDDSLRTTADRLHDERWTVAVAALAGIAGTIGSFAVAGATTGFVAAPIAGFLARTLPGWLLTAAIVLLGSLGQQLNLLTAIGLSAAGFAVLAGAGLALGRRTGAPGLGAIGSGVGSALLAFLLTGALLPAVAAGVGVTAVSGLSIAGTSPAPMSVDPGRRGTLKGLAGAIGVAVLGAGVRASGLVGSDGVGGDVPEDAPADVRGLLSRAADLSLDVEGMEPLVSEEFYEVDISAVNPDVDAATWTLAFTGAVAEGREIDYETLTGMEAEHRFNTLRCVGESLNGHKMDNALWTGVPLAPLLADLEIRSDCECVMLRAVDDYYEEFPLAALERGFLAWGMNGGDLPRRHGYPVRALIPGHWGEINVKWLTEIEFLERETDGFWEERGWHGTGPVNTVAKLHAVNHGDDGRIQVGGHAYAGTRGIRAVEISTDGGGTWTEATLSEPLPGEDVWRQWMHEYEAPGVTHEVVVRAIDGTGALQPEESTPAYPNGATGWVSRRLDG